MSIYLRTELRQYQQVGVLRLHRFNGRALLADEMGLGKSLQALLYAIEAELGPVIIITKASLKHQWQAEAKRHLGIRTTILESRKPLPQKGFKHRPQFVIINYEILGPWLNYLHWLRPQLIIIDECAAVKNRSTARARCCRALAQTAKHLIAVSGAPFSNKPVELWSVLNMLWPKHYPNFVKFAHKFSHARLRWWGWEYKGARNLKLLHSRLRKRGMIRRLKVDVLDELPPKTRTVVPVQLAKKDMREYNKALFDFIDWLKRQDASKARRAKKAEELTKQGYLKRLAAWLKMPYVIDWIDNFLEQSDSKLLVYGIQKRVLAKLHETFPHSVVINSSVTGRKRQLALEQFDHDKRTRLLFGNIDAAGEGLNLQVAPTGLNIELDWRPDQMAQVEARNHRLGQLEKVEWYYLITENTIEERLCEVIELKSAIQDAILDGRTTSNHLDIHTQLTRLLKRDANTLRNQ